MGISDEINDATIAIDETTKRRFRNHCSHGWSDPKDLMER